MAIKWVKWFTYEQPCAVAAAINRWPQRFHRKKKKKENYIYILIAESQKLRERTSFLSKDRYRQVCPVGIVWPAAFSRLSVFRQWRCPEASSDPCVHIWQYSFHKCLDGSHDEEWERGRASAGSWQHIWVFPPTGSWSDSHTVLSLTWPQARNLRSHLTENRGSMCRGFSCMFRK